MVEPEKVVLSWSGGKDSAMALYEMVRAGRYEVVALLTTVAEQYRRISHHGVREELLKMQAAALGLPLDTVYLPASSAPCTNEEFEALMARALARYEKAGVRTVAHGDLFLADLRAYRERNLARLGMRGLFPIWGRDTSELVTTFVHLGFKAYVCAVDGAKLPSSFAGRLIDQGLIGDLPSDVDPCGENGEYHSFVFDGPIFRSPLRLERGEVVTRENRHYAELFPMISCDAGAAPETSGFPPIRP
jgi:uncharacterized protein (TIGR00290 family)